MYDISPIDPIHFPAPIFTVPAERLAINFSWLYKLRWVALLGQMLTILLVRIFMDPLIPYAGMIAILVGTTITNIALGFWLNFRSRYGWSEWRNRGEWILRLIIAFDIVSLTGLLYLSGGPTNPFTTLYLVNIALAAVLVDLRSAWLLCVLALLGFFLLFWHHVPVGCLECTDRDASILAGSINLHLQGMLIAFGLAAALIVHFISRVNRSLAQREAELFRIQEQKIRDEKLDALATLAAGAAHELASPLSTIAVVVRELEIELGKDSVSSQSLGEMQVIRTEVDRCRGILDRMAASAGEAVGEKVIIIAVPEIIKQVINGLSDTSRIDVSLNSPVQNLMCRIPKEAVCQAIRAIVQNALDASQLDQCVRLDIRAADGILQIMVTDAGEGMDEKVLRRVGEPFFTTKEPGKGIGLGIFLARRILERLGGTLTLRSSSGKGTTVSILLPYAVTNAKTQVHFAYRDPCDILTHHTLR